MVLPRNHPRDSNARGRKNSNLATWNRAPTITKNSTNTVLVNSWPTPFRLHQWRSEMCDFVCKSCFIHLDLPNRLYHPKTTSTSQGTISLQGTVLQALTVESACIIKTTPNSSPWNIYRILILKQCGRGFSRPDYRVESLVGLLALSTTWLCLNI